MTSPSSSTFRAQSASTKPSHSAAESAGDMPPRSDKGKSENGATVMTNDENQPMVVSAAPSSSTPNSTHNLVVPVPRYASAAPLSQFNSNRSGQSDMTSSAAQTAATVTARQQTPASLRQTDKAYDFSLYSDILPKCGREEDAAAAVQKLERIERTKQSKRRWRRGTGIAGLEYVATAKGKDASKSKNKKENADDDAASTTSSLNLYSEVRLAISSMPGFTVLASKARHVLDRSDSPGPDSRGATEKEGNQHGEEGGHARSLAFRFGGGAAAARRRSSLIPPPTEMLNAQANGLNPLVEAQTDHVPEAPASSNDANPNAEAASKVYSANAELDVLKEERAVEEIASEVAECSGTAGETAQKDLIRPKPQRPKLIIRSPSEQDNSFPTALMMDSPEGMQPMPNVLSNLVQADKVNAETSQNGNDQTAASVPGDRDARAIAEQIQRAMSQSPSIFDESARGIGSGLEEPGRTTSVNSPSTLSASGSESDTEDTSALEDEEDEQEVFSLNLEHGQELTQKQKKRLLRHVRRNRRKQIAAAAGEATEQGTASRRARAHKRTASLSNHISTGLHYASSQSRNRRAMEKYSPHPSRPASTKPYQAAGNALGMTSIASALSASQPQSQQQQSLSRSSTPANAAATSERSSLSNDDSTKDQKSALPSETDDFGETLTKNLLRRWGTNQSGTSILPSGSLKGASFKNRLLSLRRNRHQPSDVAEEEVEAPVKRQEDAEKELDNALSRLIAQEEPDQLREQYEYDVLYENQRGMLVFGIPKFSSKTLFQWDPAAWTDVYNGDSAYNIVNAQLPNPSWEWVHPEWMIDMSGDVDESGWQYAYNFGRFALPFRIRPAEVKPRANAKGNQITNERFDRAMKRMNDREERYANREDDGFEALKRSALSRNAKWSGIPTQNTYVRRRRWIRLRRRKPLQISNISNGNTPKAGTPMEMSKGSNDWSQLIKGASARAEAANKDRKAKRVAGGADLTGTLEDDDDGRLSDFEEGSLSSSSGSSSGSAGYERQNGNESTFLARQTYGNLESGRDPLKVRKTRDHQRKRRHAREFTGTIRELKSLLPTILDRRHGRGHRQGATNRSVNERQKSLWLMEIDARNPFISWTLVKRRLEDDDLAFAATTLRTYERRHAQRIRQNIASPDIASNDKTNTLVSVVGQHAPWEQYELTKDALVEINFRRVLRVMKACKVDRQKLQLWRVWLNVEPINVQMEPSRNEDLIELGLAASSAAASESLLRSKEELARLVTTRWRSAYRPADTMDVWDVIERRLDRLLLTFEHQSSRASFLRLLLTIHATSHAQHRFRPVQWRMPCDETESNDRDHHHADAPMSLSPERQENVSEATGDEWRAARVPRLEFYSDLIDCARALIVEGKPTSKHHNRSSPMTSPKQNGAAELSPAEQRNSPLLHAQLLYDHSASEVADIGRSRSPVVVPGLSFAMTTLSRSSTPSQRSSMASTSVPRRLSLTQAASPPTSGIFTAQARGHITSKTGSPSLGGQRGLYPDATSASPPAQTSSFAPMATNAQASDFDQQFLAQLLQLPIHLQKDVVLQSSSSVFETKKEAQLRPHMPVTTRESPRMFDSPGTTPPPHPEESKSDEASKVGQAKTIHSDLSDRRHRLSRRHSREESDVVRTLSKAVDSDAAESDANDNLST